MNPTSVRSRFALESVPADSSVDSKLLIFPEEGHWIQKPQNSKLWYDAVLEWLAKHL